MDAPIYCIIMAGGQGSRLWPISQPELPKQFIDLVGCGRTMLQLTYDRFRQICDPKHFIVVTNEMFYDLVHSQLPDLPVENILREPFRRNTAACIAFANTYVKQLNKDAVTIVTPSDHIIMNDSLFLDSVRHGALFAKDNDALVTIGIKAYKPETAFGYIQFGEPVGGDFPLLYKVKTFTEKPNLEMAQVFYECGDFCWNAGVFIWSVNAIEMALSKYLPNIQSQFDSIDPIPRSHWTREAILRIYDECDNISIDYGIMERARNVYVEQTDASWSDLGGYDAIYEQADKDKKRNAVTGGRAIMKNSSGCLVTLPKDKTCVIEGLSDYMVVENDQVLLICPRANGRLVSNYAADLNASINQ